jgi:hypothetical protein
VKLHAKAKTGKIRRVKPCPSLFMIYLPFDLVFCGEYLMKNCGLPLMSPASYPFTIIYRQSKGVFWGGQNGYKTSPFFIGKAIITV